jgi:uncharacterized protein (TIGR03437 family)
MKFLFLAVLGTLACAGTLLQLPALPRGATAMALQADGAGNIYVAGSLPAGNQNATNTTDAFVAKLAPGGSSTAFFTVLAGSGNDTATAIAIGVDGSIYVTGTTSSMDFPTTSGALQSTYGLTSAMGTQAFAAKLSTGGAVEYSTYLGGNVVTAGVSLAVDAAGDAFILGTGLPAGVPNLSGGDATNLGGFVIEVNPTGTQAVTAFAGLGGQYIALDAQGLVYLAGASTNLPQFTPGAFQTSGTTAFCGGSLDFVELCPNTYVAKVDPARSVLIYLTGLNGSYGATPSGIAVDVNGNVVIAGSTQSADFPVTASSFQTTYTPVTPPNVVAYGPGPLNAPLATGFAAKLNPSGSGLIWSTFFGGTATDSITTMSVRTDAIYLAGKANSSDLPGLSETPAGCRPSTVQALRFAARLEPDGSGISQVQLLYGASDYTYGYPSGLPPGIAPLSVASPAAGTAIVLDSTGAITDVDFFANSQLACLTDPADNVQLTSVAPGQDLTIFGSMLAQALVQPGAPISTATSDVAVSFNGLPGTVLYGYGDQVNVQVPSGIPSSGTLQMQLTNTDTSASVPLTRDLSLVAQQPSVFLSASALAGDIGFCYTKDSEGTGIAGTGTPLAFALNADGSVNAGDHPAAPGSTVTLFLNGVANSASVTGQVDNAATTFTPVIAGREGGALPFTFTLPVSVTGENVAIVSLKVNGVVPREPLVSVCVQLPATLSTR